MPENDDMREVLLYRHYDKDGVLLYIGVSANIEHRTYEHKALADWRKDIDSITTEPYSNRRLALEAEISAIKKEKPLYNHGGLKYKEKTIPITTRIPKELLMKLSKLYKNDKAISSRTYHIRKAIELYVENRN